MSKAKLTQLGRYEVGEVLGRGGMGVVYRGHDPRLGRDVALKTIRADALTSPDQHEELIVRLRREAGAAARLSHPNVVTIFDIDEVDGYVFVAMELMKGTPLDEILTGRTAPDLAQVDFLLPICEALEHLHEHGIIHRDLKPANIMVLPDGLVKLMDFGIAKDLMSQDITQTGAIMGTPIYMAPEQFLGEAIDARADLFAAGVILFDICCADRPFPGNTPMAIMQQVMSGELQAPRELNPEIPEVLEAVLRKALARKPEDRFQTAAEMAEAIERCLDELPDANGMDRPRKGLAVRRTTRALTEADQSSSTEADASPAPQPPGSEPGLDEMATLPPPPAPRSPSAVAPAENRVSRAPVGVAIGLAVAVALGVGGFLATRDSDDAAPEPDASIAAPDVTGAAHPDDGPKAIVTVPEQWIGGVLALDEKEFPIERSRILVPAGRYEELMLAKPCVQEILLDGPTLAEGDAYSAESAPYLPVENCP